MSRHVGVQRRSLETQAADVLRNGIVRGQFAPGARVTEEALAESLEISRGTMRSALQKLAFEGLVCQLPYRGWVIPSLTPQDAWELYTLRASLEGLAARLVAACVTPEKVKALKAALRRLSEAAEARNRTAMASADFDFHKGIIRLAGHGRLARQYALVEQQVRIYIASCNAPLPNLDEIARQHQPIVTAICEGQGDTAEQLARAHNTVDGEALVRHLQSRSSVPARSAR